MAVWLVGLAPFCLSELYTQTANLFTAKHHVKVGCLCSISKGLKKSLNFTPIKLKHIQRGHTDTTYIQTFKHLHIPA